VWVGEHATWKPGSTFLRELKEKNIMVVKWKAGVENSSDMFTNNLPKKEFNKHAAVYVGLDEYMVQP